MSPQAELKRAQRAIQDALDRSPDRDPGRTVREIPVPPIPDFLAMQRVVAESVSLRRAVEGGAADEVADGIVAALDRMTGAGLDQDLRHLYGQVARQARLPRDAARDHRFLTHLEWALRDLATSPFEPRSPALPDEGRTAPDTPNTAPEGNHAV